VDKHPVPARPDDRVARERAARRHLRQRVDQRLDRREQLVDERPGARARLDDDVIVDRLQIALRGAQDTA